MARFFFASTIACFAILASTSAASPLIKLLNAIANDHILKELSSNLPAKIEALGLDPLKAIKADEDLKAEDVVGLSNVKIDSMEVISVSLSDTDTVAEFHVKGHLTKNLTGKVFLGKSGFNAEAEGLRTKDAILIATMDLQNLVVKSITVKSFALEYDKLHLKALDAESSAENTVTLTSQGIDLLKTYASSKVKEVGQATINRFMPMKLPEPAVEEALFFP